MRTAMAGLLALVLGLLVGCARPPMDPAADRTAREFFAAVQARDAAGIEARVAPQVTANPAHLQLFDQVRTATPPGSPNEVRAIGWEEVASPAGPRTAASHLYRYATADLVVRTTLQPAGDGFRVANLMVSRLPPGRIEANRFTLAGKPLAQYAFLATGLLSPLVMLAVALMALSTPGLSFRPAWALLALVGIGSAMMNWTTGQGDFEPARIGLINLGATRATDISPWILRFSAPVGAILVLVRLVFVRTRDQATSA